MKKTSEDMLLMRIFIKESDRFEGRPLYLALLEHFKAAGLSGATVLRGIAGFGAHSHLHTDRILHLTQDLPTVVEVVEREDRIQAVMPQVDVMLDSGLVTLEKATVITYTHPQQRDTD